MADHLELEMELIHAPLESEILLYLYNHPTADHDTAGIAFNLRAPSLAPDELPTFDEAYTQKQQQDVLAVQTAIESLVLAQCVIGTRAELGSTVEFTGLKLTQKGEEEAIRAKRNLKELATESV